MPGKSDTFENDLLLLLFNNTNIANIGDATGVRGSTVAGSFYFAIHTADPGEAGNQSTNEGSYTLYARVPVARSSAGFTVTGNAVALAADVQFPTGTGGGGVAATHWSAGTLSSGAGKILYSGTLTPNVMLGVGVGPKILAGTIVTED